MHSERTVFNTLIPELYDSITELQQKLISTLIEIANKDQELSTDDILQLEQDILAQYPVSKSTETSLSSESFRETLTNRVEYVVAKGFYLSSFLSESMGKVNYDSLNSKLLSLFPQPMSYDASLRTQFLQRLQKQFRLSDEELERIKSETAYVISNLQVKKAIVAYLKRRLSTGLSHNSLFESITGIKALSHDSIDITIANATLFFIFNFSEHGLDPDRQFSLNDHNAINELFQKLKLQSNRHRADFPAVGEWSSIQLSDSLINDLQRFLEDEYNLHLTKVAVRNTLVTMVFILPRKSADSFLVHDAYGHAWQENLCEFEHLYRFLSDLRTPIKFEELPELKKQTQDNIVESITNYFYTFYSRKLAVAHNAVLAELTADVFEYHLQKKLANQGQSIPTSSKLRDLVLFVDLTISDIQKHFTPIKNAIAEELSTAKLNQLKRFLTQYLPESELDNSVNKIESEIANIQKVFTVDSPEQFSKVQLATLQTVLLIYPFLKSYGDQDEPYGLHQYVLCLTTFFQEFENHGFYRLPQLSMAFETIL